MSNIYEQIKKPTHEMHTMLALIRMGINAINHIVDLENTNDETPLVINNSQKVRLRKTIKNIEVGARNIQAELDKINEILCNFNT